MDSVNLATWLCSLSLTHRCAARTGISRAAERGPRGRDHARTVGSGIQVLKEKNHFDILCSHVPSDGVSLLLVSLHKEIHTLKNGTQRPLVDVRLDGKRVGELSNVTSARLLPLLEHTEAVCETALAFPKITGSALAAQPSGTPLKPPRSATIGFPMGHARPRSSSHWPHGTRSQFPTQSRKPCGTPLGRHAWDPQHRQQPLEWSASFTTRNAPCRPGRPPWPPSRRQRA